MADIVSSLPIESRAESQSVKVSKDINANADGNRIFVQAKVSKDGNDNSVSNPIFVQLASAAITGEVHDYLTSVAVGSGASVNHDYNVTAGKTLLLRRVIASASGQGRFEVQVGPTATLVSKGVQFNSTANPNVEFVFDPPIEITEAAGGEKVRVIRKNREGAAQDVYSTIMGNEV